MGIICGRGSFVVHFGDHLRQPRSQGSLLPVPAGREQGCIYGTVNHSLWTLTLFLSADFIEQNKSHVLLEVIDINVRRFINLTKSTREASFKFLTLQSE